MGQAGGLFGRIALKKGLVSEGELLRALRVQEELRAFGLQRPLGEVLVADGALTRESVKQVLRLQKINEQHVAAKQFGKIALRNELLSEEQLNVAFEELKRGRYERSLEEILVEGGAITEAAARAINRALRERAEQAESGASQRGRAAAEEDTIATTRIDATTIRQHLSAESPTVILGEETMVFDATDLLSPEEAEGWSQDLLFAAVALREGRVLLSELERALKEQRLQVPVPRLSDVLVERGVLTGEQVDAVERSVEEARSDRLRIPGYDVVGLLGQGATSLVLRGRHELLGREVAIKVLRHDSEAGAALMLEEARLTASVTHPNLVVLYEVGQLKRRIFFVMELVDGPTLMTAIRRSKKGLPVREALRHARDVARALGALEMAGLVHRDVKPHNVLLAPDGAKLADLGLARRVGWRQEEGTIDGTPHTISPEQAQGSELDIRSDLYGLGATLYYALTGQPPYDGSSPLKIVLKHINDPVPDPRALRPELSAEVSALVRRLLAKELGDRPASPAALLEELEGFEAQ